MFTQCAAQQQALQDLTVGEVLLCLDVEPTTVPVDKPVDEVLSLGEAGLMLAELSVLHVVAWYRQNTSLKASLSVIDAGLHTACREGE